MYGSGRLQKRSLSQMIDWKLIICYLLLILIGWLNIYASIHSSEPSSILDFSVRSGKQAIWILTALILATLILFAFNPRLWEVLSIPSYVIVVFLLILVIFVSSNVKGSHSWFDLGPVRFQPAELSKITTSLVLAMWMSRQNFKMSNAKDFLGVCLILGVPMLAILAESETGSMLVYVGFIFVLYREGLSGWLLAAVGLIILLFILTLTASTYVSILVTVGLVSLYYSLQRGKLKRWIFREVPFIVLLCFLPKIWSAFEGGGFLEKVSPLYVVLALLAIVAPIFVHRAYRENIPALWLSLLGLVAGLVMTFSAQFVFDKVLQDHQKARIEVLLGLKEDPSGVGYNVNQSMIAIGSGGFAGKGYLKGTQTTYGFVPEQSTDFIFCTVGEEWGFLGCVAVILLYAFLIMRIIQDADECRESFTRIYGYCVASLIFMHLFINIGMCIGLMPVIGIPLPMLSYGGSSLWSFTILIFIFLALYKQENKYF